MNKNELEKELEKTHVDSRILGFLDNRLPMECVRITMRTYCKSSPKFPEKEKKIK